MPRVARADVVHSRMKYAAPMTVEMIADRPPCAAIWVKSGAPFASSASGAANGAETIPATMATRNPSTSHAAARGIAPA